MKKIFSFGEIINNYDFKVINERDARASAGIMFLLGIITLFSFFMTRNLFWANLFTITFILEFIIRVFINPNYAPYMILGSLIVSNQEPDWVEAKPKKFAWILGVILGMIMSYFIIFNIMTPFRLLTCLLCLVLLYMESIFGICLGCIVYKKLNYKLYKCPGGVCEVSPKNKNLISKIILILFFGLFFYGIYFGLKEYKYNGYTTSRPSPAQIEEMEFDDDDEADETTENKEVINKNSDCNPPQWAIDMGHRDMWLKHHDCN